MGFTHHRRYDKIHRFGHSDTVEFFNFDNECVIEEKVDGANFQFAVAGKPSKGTPLPLRFGSRNQTTDKGDNQWAEYIQAMEDTLEGKFDLLNPEYVYYVEVMKPHTIQYDWENTPPILGLDVYDVETCQYLPYDEKVEIFEELGIEVVPLLWKGTVFELAEKLSETASKPDTSKLEDLVPKSQYRDDDGLAEGIVVKIYDRVNRYGRPLFAKFVTDMFKEQNRNWHKNQQKKKGKKQEEPEPHEEVVGVYATPARIRKCIMRLAEESGKDIGLPMMGDLIKMVSEDILEEEIVAISYKHPSFNFKRFRNTLAPVIKKEIEEFLLEQALQIEKKRRKQEKIEGMKQKEEILKNLEEQK